MTLRAWCLIGRPSSASSTRLTRLPVYIRVLLFSRSTTSFINFLLHYLVYPARDTLTPYHAFALVIDEQK